MKKKSVTLEGQDLADLVQLLEYVTESEEQHYRELVDSEGEDAMMRHVFVLAVHLQNLVVSP